MTGKGVNGSAVETVAGFVSPARPAFFLQFRPARVPRAHLVYLPPFGEEMNRCRSLVAQQARWFASQGLSCSLLDFYGSGESRGDLTDASLAIWRKNIDDLLEQLMEQDQCKVYLWGCRLGALLAVDYLSRRPGAANKLLLWQPVISGSSFITQMLRQRMVSLMQKGKKTENTADMKLRLAAGDSIEVAGYRVGGELVSNIERLEMTALLDPGRLEDNIEIFWMEHAIDKSTFPTAKSAHAITELQNSRVTIVASTFTGDPIWQLQRRGLCDDLLAQTRKVRL